MRTGLIALLSSRANIRDIVGSRIFLAKAPQNAAFPYIVVTQMGSQEYGSLDGTSELRGTEFDIDCKAQTSTQSEQLGRAVWTFLKDYTGPAGTETIKAVHFTDESISYEPPTDGSDIGTHVTLLDITIQHQTNL